jgi:glycosyltransferase involved in cell wall biosynthesis
MQEADRDGGVSVVIPSYNHARFVATAIESALAQTLEPTEVVIVDDGSTDDTVAILDRYRHTDGRVRVLLGRHAGIGATYTLGVAEARCEFVAFLESDDAWAPTYLSETVGYLRRHPGVDWVNTSREIIDEHGRATGQVVRKPSPGSRITTESLLTCDLGYTPTPVVRLRALREVGPFDPTTHAADCDIALRFSCGHGMAYIDRPLYRYRRHAGNASGNRLRDTLAVVAVLERFKARHGSEIGPLDSLLERCLAKYQGRAGVYTLEEDPIALGDEALMRFRTAMRIHPTELKHLRRWLAAEILGPKYYAKFRRRSS